MTTKPNHYAGINHDNLKAKAADLFNKASKPAGKIVLFDCYYGKAEFVEFFESQNDLAIYMVGQDRDYEDGGIENPITVDLN